MFEMVKGKFYGTYHDLSQNLCNVFTLEWDEEKRRPVLIEDKCLSCMICSFVCPVSDIISFTEMPKEWKRQDAEVMDKSLETRIKYKPFNVNNAISS